MPGEESIASEVLSASLGGAISASLLYPLEVLKTKMQAETKGHNDDDNENSNTTTTENDNEHTKDLSDYTMIEYASHLYKTQGAGVFVQGIETSAFQSSAEKALYFFAYTGLKRIYKTLTGQKSISTFPSLLLGCLAEWAHLPLTLPLDCWTTAIQTNTIPNKGAMQLLFAMLSEKGIKGMYKGIQAYTVLCLKPALQYTVFEQVRASVIQGRGAAHQKLSAAESFILGMIARAVSTICIFPYLRAKVMLQSSSDSAKTSIPTMLADMYKKGGFAAWFQGLGPELTRGVLSSALMLMIKEQIAQLVRDALQGSNNTRPRRRRLR